MPPAADGATVAIAALLGGRAAALHGSDAETLRDGNPVGSNGLADRERAANGGDAFLYLVAISASGPSTPTSTPIGSRGNLSVFVGERREAVRTGTTVPVKVSFL